MALDYRKCAQEIFDNLGGKDNIVSAAHCATRLRLVIADNSKLNKEALENVDGVKGMFENGGQLQLIIGTGTVNKVYEEFIDISGVTAATKDEVKAYWADRGYMDAGFDSLVKEFGYPYVAQSALQAKVLDYLVTNVNVTE